MLKNNASEATAERLEPTQDAWKSSYAMHIAAIETPYSLAELRAKIDSNEYSAELLLQHAMRLLENAEQARIETSATTIPPNDALVIGHVRNEQRDDDGDTESDVMRDTIEQVANAIGYTVLGYDARTDVALCTDGVRKFTWSPRRNDGDSFRLANSLSITMQFPWGHNQRNLAETVCWSDSIAPIHSPHGGDRNAASRMGIFAAALEMTSRNARR